MIGDDEDVDDADDSLEHATSAVAGLVSYGAATALPAASGSGEARVRLTELGRMLAESIFTGCARPIRTSPPGQRDPPGTVTS